MSDPVNPKNKRDDKNLQNHNLTGNITTVIKEIQNIVREFFKYPFSINLSRQKGVDACSIVIYIYI